MLSSIAILASVLTVNMPSSDRAEVSLSGSREAGSGIVSAAASVKTKDGLTVFDFTSETATNGLVRNFFNNEIAGGPYSLERRFREMTFLPGCDAQLLFMRDTVRTFGPPHLPSRICRYIRDGETEIGTLVVRSDALFGESYISGSEEDFDVILDGTVISGDDKAWQDLVRIAMDEGFNYRHAGNWLRLQGRGKTGDSKSEYPVLIDTRGLMVCALVCDFCESVPDVYAYRTRVQSGTDRTGFRFVIGERPNRRGISSALQIHRQLLEDDEYCRGYADLIYESCVRPDGEFSRWSCIRRIDRRIAELREVCGDAVDFKKAVRPFELLKNRLAERAPRFVEVNMLSKLLSVPAPLAVGNNGKQLPAYGKYRGEVKLNVKADAGKVYYSEDGSDPREVGGGVNPRAKEYTGAFKVDGRCQLRARTLAPDGEWSALEMVNLNF